MNTSTHRPSKVTVSELDNSNAIVLIIEDDLGNCNNIFFEDYNLFFNFSQLISKGGTYGTEFELKTKKRIWN